MNKYYFLIKNKDGSELYIKHRNVLGVGVCDNRKNKDI